MSKRRVISYSSKMRRSCKIFIAEDFFFKISCQLYEREPRAPSSSSSARTNTPHTLTHRKHAHIDCEEIYCDRTFAHHYYNNNYHTK